MSFAAYDVESSTTNTRYTNQNKTIIEKLIIQVCAIEISDKKNVYLKCQIF